MVILAYNFDSCEQKSFWKSWRGLLHLFALEEISNCPVGELLDMSHCQKTASEINVAILTSQSHEKGLPLDIVPSLHASCLPYTLSMLHLSPANCCNVTEYGKMIEQHQI